MFFSQAQRLLWCRRAEPAPEVVVDLVRHVKYFPMNVSSYGEEWGVTMVRDEEGYTAVMAQ